MDMNYVLITPARNEESFIENTIKAVVSQTVLPRKWVIVSDGSTDNTDKIVEYYAKRYTFIKLVKTENTSNRNFGSKAKAFNTGYKKLGPVKYNFIGNLDADVTFEPEYFENILKQFEKKPRLGIGGGIIVQLVNNTYYEMKYNLKSVAGAVQLFRRQCYENIGGYIPLKFGGIDAAVEIIARMKGWEIQTYPDYKVYHHRRIGTGYGSIYKSMFQKGINNYTLGYHPVFHIFHSIYFFQKYPYIIGGLLMILGYNWALLSKFELQLPRKVIDYLRSEQIQRMKKFTSFKNLNRGG